MFFGRGGVVRRSPSGTGVVGSENYVTGRVRSERLDLTIGLLNVCLCVLGDVVALVFAVLLQRMRLFLEVSCRRAQFHHSHGIDVGTYV